MEIWAKVHLSSSTLKGMHILHMTEYMPQKPEASLFWKKMSLPILHITLHCSVYVFTS